MGAVELPVADLIIIALQLRHDPAAAALDRERSDPEAPGTLYAGFGDGTILRSADAGEGWEEAARVPAGLQALAVVTE